MGLCNSTMDNCTLTTPVKRKALLAMGVQGVAATIVCLIAIALVFIFKLYKYFAHRTVSPCIKYWRRCCTEQH